MLNVVYLHSIVPDNFRICTSHKASITTISLSKDGTNPPLPRQSVVLCTWMSSWPSWGVEAARAKGMASTVSAEEVTASSGPPVSTALAFQVLRARIKERCRQQRMQPCWRGALLLIGPSHLLQADHCYSTWPFGKYSNHGEQTPKGRLLMYVLKM